MRDAVASREEGVIGGTRGSPDRALILGRYRPVRPLGSGGSGSVWLAADEHAARDVALKIVRREGKAASRAEREVEAATRLRHPRCLRALALDRDDEHVYVAYEYVRGRTLREVMRAGSLDDRSAVEAGAQVLEGLAHAHAKGVVHRDVKPANVMLEEGDAVSVRLLDFGLARVEEADTLTAAGDVPGTLAYVSPERLDGRPASGAADVWSVGVMLWEALAGWHPFSAPSPVETARRIRAGATPLAEVRPDLPADLCGLVDRMLARDPRRRPAPRRLPDALRDAFAARTRRPRPAVSLSALRERALHAGLAAAYATGAALLLPFFPRGWPFLLGAVAGIAALRSPRTGLAFALAVPFLPLGNIALGLALAYALLALAWFAVFARDPTSALLAVGGPALAPIGGLCLLPVLALRARGPVRPAVVAGAGALAAAAVAALVGAPFPVGALPSELAVGATDRPDAALRALLSALAAHPAIVVVAGVLAAATLTAGQARAHGIWGVAFWGSAVLGAAAIGPTLAGAPTSGLLLAPGVWAAALLLAVNVWRDESPGPPEALADERGDSPTRMGAAALRVENRH